MAAKLTIALGVERQAAGSRPKAKDGAKAPSNVSGNAPGGALPAELRQKILERDDHTCAACGFRSLKYQDIHQLNGNAEDLSPANLITTCIFCHQCFRLNRAAEMRSGVLIWMPEVPQTDLHHMARAIYVARISQGPVAEAARKGLDLIMQRREEARKRLETDDPFILAAVLHDYISDRAYESRGPKLDGVRLFPLDRRIIKETDLEFNQFPQILAYWRAKDGPFGGVPPRQWLDIYRQVAKAA